MKLRVKFVKYGPMRFIGHLDVMRYFQKAIRRAGIDICYSAGFSPHQIMSFAAPLGVGLTSRGEYMDIQVNTLPNPEEGFTPCQSVVRRLNCAGVAGLDVVDVRILPENAGNAMSSVAAASYNVRFRQARLPLADGSPVSEKDIQENLPRFLGQSEILFMKETKHGTRQVDLRPGIYELAWESDCLHMLLNASSSGNIKPGQVMESLSAYCGCALQENSLLVTRNDLFTKSESGELISLGEIGYAQDVVDMEVSGKGGVL